jgi:hypothetical protein
MEIHLASIAAVFFTLVRPAGQRAMINKETVVMTTLQA